MMNDWETDKKIAEWIRNALENREERYISGAWENFVNRRKRKRRIIFIKSASGIAAALIGVWLILQVLVPESNNNRLETNFKTPERTAPSDEWPEKEATSVQPPFLHNQVAQKAKSTMSRKSEKDGTEPKLKKSVVQKEKLAQVAIEETIALLDSVPAKTSEPKYFADTLLAGNGKSKPDSEEIVSVLPDELDIVRGNAEKQKSGLDKMRFGIHFSPGFNSTTSSSTFAFSGGVSADFRLSRALFLSTGIQAELQNVHSRKPNKEFMAIDNQTTADLLLLDVPLNITWKFLTGKSTAYYVSGGISSLAYLNEDYRNKATTQEVVEVVNEENGQETVEYKVVIRETVTNESVLPLKTFDFASRLNLTMGAEHKITPGLHLHIEPYVKIPLSGLGAQNLKFTTSGVTCKVSF
jgi:hypothetical protein